MNFPKFDTLKDLKEEDIRNQVDSSKKDLFDLRLKKATRQSFKPHLFKHTKRKIAQLLTLKSEKLRIKNES
jgi:large subunit ribosomal protein L29